MVFLDTVRSIYITNIGAYAGPRILVTAIVGTASAAGSTTTGDESEHLILDDLVCPDGYKFQVTHNMKFNWLIFGLFPLSVSQ